MGGEGLPYRDQVKEKREQRKPHEMVELYGVFRIVLEVMCASFNRDMFVYAGLLKERCIILYLKTLLNMRLTQFQYLGFMYGAKLNA